MSLPAWPPLGSERPLEDACASDGRRLQIISSVFNPLRGNTGALILVEIIFLTLPPVVCESIHPRGGPASVSVGTEDPGGARYQAAAINI